MHKKGLAIYTSRSPFFYQDISILRKNHTVDEYFFKSTKDLNIILSFIKQFIFLIVRGWKYDFYFISFAQYHSLLPTLFGRLYNLKTYVLVGGTDAHRFPEFNYGNFNNFWLSIATKYSLKNANYILPKHSSLIESTYTYATVQFTGQGYMSLQRCIFTN